MKAPKDFYTFCHVCPAHCSRKITVENGKITSVDRDLESGLVHLRQGTLDPGGLLPSRSPQISPKEGRPKGRGQMGEDFMG